MDFLTGGRDANEVVVDVEVLRSSTPVVGGDALLPSNPVAVRSTFVASTPIKALSSFMVALFLCAPQLLLGGWRYESSLYCLLDSLSFALSLLKVNVVAEKDHCRLKYSC